MKILVYLFLVTWISVRADPLHCFLLTKDPVKDTCQIERKSGEAECSKFDDEDELRKEETSECLLLTDEDSEIVACFCNEDENCPEMGETFPSTFNNYYSNYKDMNTDDEVHPLHECFEKWNWNSGSGEAITSSKKTTPATRASTAKKSTTTNESTTEPTTTAATSRAAPTTSRTPVPTTTTLSPETGLHATGGKVEPTTTTAPPPMETTTSEVPPTTLPGNLSDISVDSRMNGPGKTDNNRTEVCQAYDQTFLYVALAVLSTLLAGTWIICLYSCINNRKKTEPKPADVLPTKVSRSATPEVATPVLVNEEKVKSNPPPPPTVAPPTLGRVNIQNLDAGFGNETTDESSTISTTTTTTTQG